LATREFRRLAVAVTVGGTLVAGCRSDALDLTSTATSPTTGALGLVIEQLPAGAAALVTISNAQGFRQSVTGPQLLPDLAPGDYTVVAADVVVGEARYTPSPVMQSTTVVAGKPTTVSVAYALLAPSGGLAVTATGIPAGASASVTVTGPGGFAQSLNGTQTLSGLVPGSYTVDAANITDGSFTWVPAIAVQTIVVSAGTIAPASVAYAASNGALTLTITGVPGGSTAAVTVSGPGGFSSAATASQTLGFLAPGTYTVTANSFAAADTTYAPQPASQVIAVTAGATAAARVTYTGMATPPTSTVGSLTVTISGSPTSALVLVSGPAGFAQLLGSSQTLSGLAPGAYTVAATSTSSSGYTYTAAPATQTIVVVVGSTVTANIAYVVSDGSLAVAVSGVPSGASANMTVTGPGGYARALTAPQTLTGLAPGSYTIAAANFVSSNLTYAPGAATQTKSVTAGSTATATVAYSASTGSLSVPLTGLPIGANGNVTVSGPGNYSQQFTASQALTGLAPGAYTIGASAVTSGGSTYTPSPATQTAMVIAGSTVTADVAYSWTAPTLGALTVTITGVPVSASVTVTGPSAFSQVLTATQTLSGLPPGAYTVTAASVTAGGFAYAPAPPTQAVTVTGGSTASATVAYAATKGAVTVTITGAPVSASVTVTGPSAFSQVLTATQTLSGLTPGSYTVTAAAVTSGATTYTPQPASQAVSVAAGATASVSAVYSAQTSATLTPGYHARSMTVVNWAGKSVIVDYKIYIPTGYTATKKWPVILAAHGSGEDGGDGVTDHSNNNTAQLTVGLGPHIAALNNQAVVVFPQVPNISIDPALWGAFMVRLLMTALNQTLAEANIDPTRIYLTGNSSGGFQVWDVLYQNPTVFAAMIPAAGGINAPAMTQNNSITDGPAAAVARLAAMPIWMFSADDDGTVPYTTYGLPIVTEWAAHGIGDPPFKHTLYHAIGGHQPTWDTAFASAATWTWLFAQHR
jgi:poly(3-hydroxybutyrate) depolymerase